MMYQTPRLLFRFGLSISIIASMWPVAGAMAQAPPALMEPGKKGYSAKQQLIDSELRSYSEPVATNILRRINIYLGRGGEKPDLSIYHYDSLPPSLRAEQDRILENRYGVRWQELSPTTKARYNHFLELRGSRAEHVATIKTAKAVTKYIEEQKRFYYSKHTTATLVKKKLVEFVTAGLMTVNERGDAVDKYETIGQAYGGIFVSNATKALKLDGFASAVVSNVAGGLFDAHFAASESNRSYLDSQRAAFTRVGATAGACLATLDGSGSGPRGTCASTTSAYRKWQRALRSGTNRSSSKNGKSASSRTGERPDGAKRPRNGNAPSAAVPKKVPESDNKASKPSETDRRHAAASAPSTEVVRLPRHRISDFIGERNVDLGVLRLDGKKNRIFVRWKALNMKLDPGGDFEVLEASLARMLGAVILRDGRRALLLRLPMGRYELVLSMTFAPGLAAITSASVKSKLGGEEYFIRVIDKKTEKSVFEKSVRSNAIDYRQRNIFFARLNRAVQGKVYSTGRSAPSSPRTDTDARRLSQLSRKETKKVRGSVAGSDSTSKSGRRTRSTTAREASQSRQPTRSKSIVSSGPSISGSYVRTTGRSATMIVRRYKSVPGGVILEGEGNDNVAKNINSASYNLRLNQFTLNGTHIYLSPVGRTETKTIFDAIGRDEKLGVSLGGRTELIYGALSKNSIVAKDLQIVDLFLAEIVFATKSWTRHYNFAGGYVPKRHEGGAVGSGGITVFFRFTGFEFKWSPGIFQLSKAAFQVTLVPLSKKKARGSQGHLPDFAAIKAGKMSKNMAANARHLGNNIAYYRRERIVRKAFAYAELAAFARMLKGRGIRVSRLNTQ